MKYIYRQERSVYNVAPLGVSLNNQALRLITNGFIARSAGLLSIGKKPAST